MARITVPVRMRWSDIDGYGHVNNAALFTLLEEARIATFWDAAAPADRSTGRAGDADSGSRTSHGRAEAARSSAAGPSPLTAEQQTVESAEAARAVAGVLAGGAEADSHTLVARQEIEYLAPLDYTQDPVPVHLWIGRIGGASLDVCYEVRSPAGQVCARAMSSVVLVDAHSGRPRRLTESERAALETLLDDPIEFRRR
ncbi:MAG TPA: thioesterase family protein [Beutenbergiaceae bacterium]|nr:thioesterase family protein [Beutenbergiaceae bacterium]